MANPLLNAKLEFATACLRAGGPLYESLQTPFAHIAAAGDFLRATRVSEMVDLGTTYSYARQDRMIHLTIAPFRVRGTFCALTRGVGLIPMARCEVKDGDATMDEQDTTHNVFLPLFRFVRKMCFLNAGCGDDAEPSFQDNPALVQSADTYLLRFLILARHMAQTPSLAENDLKWMTKSAPLL